MIHVSIESTPKEHVENVVLIELMIGLMIPLLILAGQVLFRASLVVYCSLLGVTKTGIGLTDLFEGLFCLWVAILIGMYFEGGLLIGFLDVLLCATFSESQNLVVVLLRKNGFASLKLYPVKLSLILLQECKWVPPKVARDASFHDAHVDESDAKLHLQ